MAGRRSWFDLEDDSSAFHQQFQAAIAASLDEVAFQLQIREAIAASELNVATDPPHHAVPAAIAASGYPPADFVEPGIVLRGVMGASTSGDASCAWAWTAVQDDQCGNGAAEASSCGDLRDALGVPRRPLEEEMVKRRDGGQREGKEPVVDAVADPGVSSAVLKPVFSPDSVPTVEICPICLQAKISTEIFEVMHCLHRFCIPCMVEYVHRNLEVGNKKHSILCAEAQCDQRLTPDDCKAFLPNKCYDTWKERLSEAEILESQRVYCPFPDCAAMLVMQALPLSEGLDSEIICRTECPFCSRLFCVRCLVPWHSNLSCFDYQGLLRVQQKRGDYSRLFRSTERLAGLPEF